VSIQSVRVMDSTDAPELPEGPKFPEYTTTPFTFNQEGPCLLDIEENGNSELNNILKFSKKNFFC